VLKQWIAAVSFELGSIIVLFSQTADPAALAGYFALHAAGSALLALALLPFVPARYAQPRRWLLAFLFSFNFFVPIAGLVCVIGGLAFSLILPRLSAAERYGKIEVPHFTTHRNTEGTGFRGGQVRAQLGNDRAPVASRLQALTAVQHTPARLTGGILRDLLADPIDDVRLLAYGMLDGKEKAISSKILAAREALEAAPGPDEARVLNKQIAEYYWELVYQNLVQGDMQKFAAEEAFRHARDALGIDAEDAGLWFMLGRLALATGDFARAGDALERARVQGFPRERMLPYLAELLFRQGRFSEVRALFGEFRGKPSVPALAPLRRYWGPV
jgi:tetratricopeptide (TPR) repeat protein